MANCKGKAANSHCGGIVHKCQKCGSVGCKNRRNGVWCSNVISKTGLCIKCGGQVKVL